MASRRALRLSLAAASLLALQGCMEGAGLPGFLAAPGGTPATGGAVGGAPRVVEQDVEAPEVFSVTAEGLWDGRPSLGGVWVAHSDVRDPERAIIRNAETGREVAGALFRRERDMPGPPIQVSAEAAAAIGMLAGQPAELQVVALRRVEVEIPAEPGAEAAPASAAPASAAPGTRPKPRPAAGGAEAAAAAPAATATVAPEAIRSEALTPAAAPEATPAAEDPLAAAARAVAAAEAEAAAGTATAAGGLARPWLQLGTFGDEANARTAADKVAAGGLAARVAGGSHQGQPIWRVLVGPAADRAALRALTEQAAALGFADAYPVAR